MTLSHVVLALVAAAGSLCVWGSRRTQEAGQ